MWKIREILNNIDKEHRVQLSAWSADFDKTEHWPIQYDLDVKKTTIQDNTIVIHLCEVDNETGYNLFWLSEYFKGLNEEYGNIKFVFEDVEVIPSFGDVGHSDKITHINFEHKNK